MKYEVAAAFRHVLARELPDWQAEGLIGETASQALVRRYELDRLGEPQRAWAASAFALLGAVAVGAGILSFVAANWSAIDSAARFAIVFATTVAAYGAGFALHARGRGALSQAAFAAAAIGFGGSIALGAQQFNVALNAWHVYALWAAGLVPLAWAQRSLAVATVALGAGAISLGAHLFAFFTDTASTTALVVHLGVLAVVAALMSRRLGTLWFREVALAVVAVEIVVAFAPSPFAGRTDAIAVVAALALVAGAARSQELSRTGILLAFVVAAPSTFWFTYAEGIESLTGSGSLEPAAIAVLGVALAAFFLVHGRAALASLVPGAALALAILLPHLGRFQPLTGVVPANALVLVPAIVLIRRGMMLRDRTAFLYGTAICAVAGFFRFAEYDHNLTTKAAAFTVVGLAFIGAALLFERRRPEPETAHAA